MEPLTTREPDFGQLMKVLNNEAPERPVLFELFLNDELYGLLAGDAVCQMTDAAAPYRKIITAFKNAGYDYATLDGTTNFTFPTLSKEGKESHSANSGVVITDRASFEAYPWSDPKTWDFSPLELASTVLPDGMKIITKGPGGIEENAIDLVGYDNLCFMLYDDPQLLADIFSHIGERMVEYYKRCIAYDCVGAIIVNDDWGYKSQTLFPPALLREHVFPWCRRIVEEAHKAGKKAILHSCGNLQTVMDEIIDDMKFDAKHSYEDVIIPVEDAYRKWGDRIAILGGIDVDYMCVSSQEDIAGRCGAMLDLTTEKGGYALGTGNSVPTYIPYEKYFAMTKTAINRG